jgi:hypothetical protein
VALEAEDDAELEELDVDLTDEDEGPSPRARDVAVHRAA